jgi:hypothetical protein
VARWVWTSWPSLYLATSSYVLTGRQRSERCTSMIPISFIPRTLLTNSKHFSSRNLTPVPSYLMPKISESTLNPPASRMRGLVYFRFSDEQDILGCRVGKPLALVNFYRRPIRFGAVQVKETRDGPERDSGEDKVSAEPACQFLGLWFCGQTAIGGSGASGRGCDAQCWACGDGELRTADLGVREWFDVTVCRRVAVPEHSNQFEPELARYSLSARLDGILQLG